MKVLGARLFDIATCCVILAWTVAAVWVVIAKPTFNISDSFGFFERAEKLSLGNRAVWVDGLYPLGYPLLLRIAAGLTGDYVIAGKAISVACGIGGLFAIYGIAKYVFSPSAGLLAVAICAMNPLYLSFASDPSTDIPAAALTLAGLASICRFQSQRSLKYLILGGSALGTGYLIRYTTLVLIPVILGWLLIQPKLERPQLQLATVFLSSFLLFASPQLVLSFLDQGNPFYNQQAQNVYFGMFGDLNWGLNFRDSQQPGIALTSIIVQHPGLFLSHWYHNIVGIPNLSLAQRPVLVFGLIGIATALWCHYTTRTRYLLLAILFMFTTSICIAFTSARLLLFSATILSIFAAYGLIATLPRQFRISRGWRIPMRIPLIIAFIAWLGAGIWPSIAHPMHEWDYDRIRVSKALVDHGMKEAPEVLSFSFDYYDMSKPAKYRFSTPWFDAGFHPYSSVADIAARMKMSGQRFLVFDDTAPQNIRGLKSIWPLPEIKSSENFGEISIAQSTMHVQIFQLK